MSLEKDLTFARVIEHHLELKRKNAGLDAAMPLEGYRVADPFENHPLFKSEEQARLEETLSGSEPEFEHENVVLAWPGQQAEAEDAPTGDPEDTLWGRSRDFDWGD
jgi:hypothetical protein